MTRRELIALAVLVMLGAAMSQLLHSARPLGHYVGGSTLAAQIAADAASPQITFGHGDLTIVLFTDYQCPACRKADRAMQRAIARDGNVRVVYRDWPIFGERSERAARIALATHRQGIYAAVHHALMRSSGLDEARLHNIVERSGGSWPQVQADLVHHGPQITGQLARNSQDAYRLGLKGTPGYLIGPFLIHGALSEEEFLRAFDQARRKRAATR
jgi:protein-disulfide isomerase